MLQASGYHVQRWEQPLSDLAARADAQTVVIFAEPILSTTEDVKAVREIVERGGRVLLTGWSGGRLAPEGNAQPPSQFQSACKLTPQGLDPLAGSGEVWMVPEGGWGFDRPRDRVQYNCTGAPAVVEYSDGKGHVVWWAGSTPLENGSIQRGGDLNLFLNALGARDGHHFYWDESLHGEIPLGVVLRERTGDAPVVGGAARNRRADRFQLQPPPRAGARSARSGARHAGGVS